MHIAMVIMMMVAMAAELSHASTGSVVPASLWRATVSTMVMITVMMVMMVLKIVFIVVDRALDSDDVLWSVLIPWLSTELDTMC